MKKETKENKLRKVLTDKILKVKVGNLEEVFIPLQDLNPLLRTPITKKDVSKKVVRFSKSKEGNIVKSFFQEQGYSVRDRIAFFVPMVYYYSCNVWCIDMFGHSQSSSQEPEKGYHTCIPKGDYIKLLIEKLENEKLPKKRVAKKKDGLLYVRKETIELP